MMETPSNSSRPTKDLTERERKLIRESELRYKDLARIFFITEDQVRYIRSSEGQRAKPLTKVWSLSEESLLEGLYKEFGWSPNKIAGQFPGKTYAQVYRKMMREYKGR